MVYMQYKKLEEKYDAPLAALIRTSLKARGLDIPGTAYFDESLDHLSTFYDDPRRAYYVLLENDAVIGGIGLAEFDGFPDCCELQKLYLADSHQGHGTGYQMIGFIEKEARAKGYKSIYLETHTNLQAAIHIYERAGFEEIPRPGSVVHSTMNKFYLKQI